MIVFPAEWHKQSAVQFTFPHEDSDWADVLDLVIPCFTEIIEIVSRHEKALVVCKDKTAVAGYLKNARQENLVLVEIPSNDTWARDHGAITVFEDHLPVLLDFVFNGWGLKFAADKDNLITGRLFEKGIFRNARMKKGGLAIEGGALESDGKGTLLTTSECLLSPNRNPHLNRNDTETALKSILGVERVLWLDHGYLVGDDTDSHIDTLARFCNPETIAYVKCDDPEDEHYGALVMMENQLKTFTQKDGKPYKLVALPMATPCYDDEGNRLPATYANFLIINDAVLVPTYEDMHDEAALDIIRSCFPERIVYGINCKPLILQHGSLHCITMQYPEGII